MLAERGVAALLEAITTGTELPRRLLTRTDGERTLTDLRHVAQALHAAATAGHLGPAALIDWLRHRIDEAAADVGVERSRRLESDAAAVQVVTMHRSKGLEFPIVYLPFGWDRNVRDPEVPLLHDERGRRVLDVGGETGEGWKERCARHRAEEAGEDLRLLYVALTRAQCQVVTWWAPATTAATSPVHRLLFGRPGPGSPAVVEQVFEPAERYRVPTDTAALATLRGAGRRGDRGRGGGRRGGAGRPGPGRRPARPRRCTRPGSTGRWTPAGDAPRTRRSTAGSGHPRAGGGQRAGGDRHRRRGRDRGAVPGGRRPAGPTRRPSCPRRWPTCRPAPRSARWCTRCSRSPSSPRPTCRPS